MSTTTRSDLGPERTGDGSFTLVDRLLDEPYHSRRGALQESQHVFIRNGLLAHPRGDLDVLEVGLGTGLNMLLTWLQAIEGRRRVRYVGLEPNPLHRELLQALDHPGQCGVPVLEGPFLDLMTGPEGEPQATAVPFTFTRLGRRLEEWQATEAFDVIYFDAFGPRAQPAMWTEEVFARLIRALHPGGLLVTYCAKGEVRRAMKRAGFRMERPAGPPGKREMIRAWRPSAP